MSGVVYLVGAGPGDPRLLTRRAADLVARADVIVTDALISDEIRQLFPSSARVIEAGKRASRHTLSQDETNQLLVELAQGGSTVVRLKGGDPFVFGRGGEEAEELSRNGVRFEVVPGISSAIAGPAYAGIPVTHRSSATSVTLVTGHESDESTGVEWDLLARSSGTKVFLMGLSRLPQIVEQLQKHGMDAGTPAAVISRATTPHQRTVAATLATIVDEVEAARLEAPALIVVGGVVALRENIQWFETRPLFGRRIVVTRAREQASDLRLLLEDAGAEVLEFPMIEIVPPASYESLDHVIDEISSYHWIVFTSRNGVEAFFDRLFGKGKDSRALSGCSVAAVGVVTSEALRRYGIVADLIPEKFQSSALLPLLPQHQEGIRTAVVRAVTGREELVDTLRERGGVVDVAFAYATSAVNAGGEHLHQLLQTGSIDCVTFTSSSTVTNFLERLNDEERTMMKNGILTASIGPVTSATLRDSGWSPSIESSDASVPALSRAVIAHFSGKNLRQGDRS